MLLRRGFAATPTTLILPPRRTVYEAVAMDDSIPVHSNTRAGIADSLFSLEHAEKSFRTAIADSLAVAVTSTRCVKQNGSNVFEHSRRFASTSVMAMGCAPDARAIAMTRRPTGPAPNTATGVPRSIGVMRRACNAMERGSRREALR